MKLACNIQLPAHPAPLDLSRWRRFEDARAAADAFEPREVALTSLFERGDVVGMLESERDIIVAVYEAGWAISAGVR